MEAVGVIESDGLGGEGIEMGRLGESIAIAAKDVGAVAVADEEEDVGGWHGGEFAEMARGTCRRWPTPQPPL